MSSQTDIDALLAENNRLIKLLEQHGIEWRLCKELSVEPEPIVIVNAAASPISTAEKITIFRNLFRGRTDVYPVRWESKTTGKSGYAPACENEWIPGVCEKPRIKCSECDYR